MKPKVSIVIPFYDCEYIDQSIKSALNQDYENVEVIVINDGSPKYREKIAPYFGKIRYHEKGNGGTGSALNVGFSIATGDYITWLSSDDLYAVNKVSKQLQFMLEKNLDASYGNYCIMNQQGEIIVESAGKHFLNKVDFYEFLKTGCHINGCTVMMKREVFRDIGTFDEAYLYTQDYDYWLRLIQKYDLDYLPDPLVLHRVHDGMGTKKFSEKQTNEIRQLNQKYASKLDFLIRRTKRMLRFTFPILTLCKGGGQRMLVEITNGLVERGHEVIILMPPQGEVEFHVKAKIVRTNAPIITAEDYQQADFIVSNFYTTVKTAEEASKSGKGVHIRLSLCYEPVFLPEQQLSFESYHLTSNLIVLSEHQQQLIKLNHGINGSIVPVGISPLFKNLHHRERMNKLQISAIVRLEEGGFSWQRGQEYLLESLRAVKSIRPDVSINLICPPNELKKSESLKALQATREFQFITPYHDEDLLRAYNHSHIFVTSSLFETAGLPGLEAMKCGAALVAVNAGGNMDYCKHMENCLISYRYENLLSKHILELVNNSPLRLQLSRQGQKEAETWDWKSSVDLFEKAVSTFL